LAGLPAVCLAGLSAFFLAEFSTILSEFWRWTGPESFDSPRYRVARSGHFGKHFRKELMGHNSMLLQPMPAIDR
jgi:hypothetical protein